MKKLRLLAWVATVSVIAIFLVMTVLSKAFVETAQRKFEMEIRQEQSVTLQKAVWLLDAFVATLIMEYSSRPLPQKEKMENFDDLTWGMVQQTKPAKVDFSCPETGKCHSPTFKALPDGVQKKMRPFSLEWEKFKEAMDGVKINDLFSRLDETVDSLKPEDQKDRFPLTSFTSPGQRLLQAVWIDQFLLLARKSKHEGKDVVQGFWLDWDRVHARLADQIATILPQGRLLPEPFAENQSELVQMATLPVFLEPGFKEPPPFKMDKNLKSLLVISWGTASMASMALILWVVSSFRLGHRRFAFASAVSHELRTPLTSFQLYTDMLSRELADGSEKAKRHVHTLTEQNRRLQRLVGHVMAYARLEKDQSVPESTAYKILELLESIMRQMEDRAAEKDMNLVLKYDQELVGFEMKGVPGGIEQIIINLLENALKYASTTEDRRIHIEVRKRGKQLHVDIRDHGPGLSPGERRRCFRPFMKSVHRVSETEGGLGLGLAISRGLAQQMGGRLVHLKTKGGGACFRLSLPVT